MKEKVKNTDNHIKRMSIYLASIALVLILLFVSVIYFSSPPQAAINSDNTRRDTLVYKPLEQIEAMNNDLSLLEGLLEHYETEDKINPKKIIYFLSKYQNILKDTKKIKDDILTEVEMNNKLKTYFKDIIENIDATAKIVLNRVNQIPVASPLDEPVGSLYVVSKFGMRNHPIHHTMRLHAGIDLRAKVGSHIIATASGRVIKNGNNGGYGYSCEIQHKNGYSTVYAHMVRTTVSTGQWVNKGDEIGFVGSTGVSEGPHLHYEVRKNNKPLNPIPYIFEGMSVAQYKKWIIK